MYDNTGLNYTVKVTEVEIRLLAAHRNIAVNDIKTTVTPDPKKTRQYTITEENEHEGETFIYVLELNDIEAVIAKRVCDHADMDIIESSYSDRYIKQINDTAGNLYMDYMAKYKIKEWLHDNDMFYKGNGLIKEVV